jgi:sortase (surface protein transpeptidase)
MTDRSRSDRRVRLATLMGSLLIVGAPAVWIAAGAPGAPERAFGTAEVLAAEPAASPPIAGDPTSRTGQRTVADDGTDAPGSDATPSDAAPSGEVPVAELPPFTSTAPRGAIDRSQWPVRLAIPALDVTAPVEAVGVGTGGELIIPPSPMDVGWYQGGSVPGEPGVALLTSHIDTRTEGRGVLSGLVRLSEGDEIVLTAADGTVQRWSVIARTQHRKDQLPAELFARAGDPLLALVTCGGPFDTALRSYRDNVIVWAQASS